MPDASPERSQPKSSHPYWAQRVDELEAPDAPPEALNLNVAGRRAMGPLQGFGQLWQKTFRIPLTVASVTPAEVVAEWKAELPRFKPVENRFYPSPGGIAPGEVVLINAWTPGGPIATGVVVLYADDESFTLMTPEGHPEAGWVTMSAYTEEGVTVAQVQGFGARQRPDLRVGVPSHGFQAAGLHLGTRVDRAGCAFWGQRATGGGGSATTRSARAVASRRQRLAQRSDSDDPVPSCRAGPVGETGVGTGFSATVRS